MQILEGCWVGDGPMGNGWYETLKGLSERVLGLSLEKIGLALKGLPKKVNHLGHTRATSRIPPNRKSFNLFIICISVSFLEFN